MAEWSPRLTRGLWSSVQRAVREGRSLAEVRDAVHATGERPDAATFSRLYSRAVEGEFQRQREAEYRQRISPELYLRRRPGADLHARLPYSLPGRYRQVVQITGRDLLTGNQVTRYVNVDTPRLVSRGDAIQTALDLNAETPKGILMDVEDATYVGTFVGE